ncbi:MAG: glycerol-3-phosphate dehydrogenase/oxidase [Pyrinomonadaceae bacterium]
MDRRNNLERVRSRTEPWDIVVIGGGATGVGCALDAASRGYDVLLLEQHDLGKGTSSRSTKLIHGGVRYLAQGNISLVREALKERGLLLKNAPHVVHKQPFVVPCYSLWEKIFYGAGLKVYDLLSGKYSFGRSRILTKTETLEHLPTIDPCGLSGGVLYFDGQFDDTRLLIDMARTADGKGAVILNYTKVTSLAKDASGKISGLIFEEIETGDKFSVTTRSVINATGAFTDAVRQMSEPEAKPVITFSQGIHLVFDRSFLPSNTALVIPKTDDGRVLFCIPWLGYLLVGTTDTPIKTTSLEPAVLQSEIDFVLETAGRYFSKKPTRRDILSVFAGIRPLVSRGNSVKTSAISRGHDLFVDDSGLVTITGGKWTTYRKMADDAVEKAITIAGITFHSCATQDLPIVPNAVPNIESERLHPDLPYTADNVITAIRDEMAQTVEDVLARRTRALFLNALAAVEVAPTVARLMAIELETDDDWINAEIRAFTQLAEGYSSANSGISDK